MLIPIASDVCHRRRAKIDYPKFMQIYERVCCRKDVDIHIVKNWRDGFLDENVFEMHIQYKNDKFFIGWNDDGALIFIEEGGLLANSPWHNGGFYDMEFYCDGEELKKKQNDLPNTMFNVCRTYFTFGFLDSLWWRLRSHM